MLRVGLYDKGKSRSGVRSSEIYYMTDLSLLVELDSPDI